MGETQDHGGAALRTQLLQHDVEPRDPLPRIQFAVERGQRLELLLSASSMSTPLLCRRSSTACSFTRLLATV